MQTNKNEMKDDLGKRMKEQYEQRTRYMLPRRTYTIIRLDGKAFHTFTRNFRRPYDEKFMEGMNYVGLHLAEDIQGAVLTYTQSDEVSILLTDFAKPGTNAWFNGNIQKIVSVAASFATGYFNEYYNEDMPEKDKAMAFFDARVFTIPDPTEVENYFIWRQKDAMRNSISMHAQSLYSQAELLGVNQSGMQDLIHDKGENWNELPEGFKRGRLYYSKVTESMSADSFDQEVYESKTWTLISPDFLKERELLTNIIPKIQ